MTPSSRNKMYRFIIPTARNVDNEQLSVTS